LAAGVRAIQQRHADTSDNPNSDKPNLAAYGARRYALERHTTIARTVAVAAIAITAPYLLWRLFFTISPEWWWLSVLLFVCDSYGLLGLTLYVFELWDVDADRAPSQPALPWKVAVLITTYNEPAEVLLPTVACSVALEPEHETWVLDDGHRPEIAELSAKLGARYLSRPDNAHAKAGNLNHALSVIDADIIGVLDADHAPSGRFLIATLPYFSDPSLAFVQTPQDFYNRDSFEHTQMGRAVYSEEDLFYKGIAPGKNRWQAAFWCGTCAVLRVLALKSVGGVATDTVTEDIHTSVRMYRQGWKGLFLPEVLSHGLAPHDAAGFLVQRHRWAQGNVQSLRLDNPFTNAGAMTAMQRLAFFTSMSTWLSVWRTLGYLSVPVLMILTGATPIMAPPELYVPLFVGILALQLVAVRLLGGGTLSLRSTMVFEMIRLPAVLPATAALLRPHRRTKFHVTPKGKKDGAIGRVRVPPLLKGIATVQAAALVWFAAEVSGLLPFHYRALIAPTAAAAFDVISLGVTMVAISRIRSPLYAGTRRAASRLSVWTQVGIEGVICPVLDLSAVGLRARIDDDHAPKVGEVVEVAFSTPDGPIHVAAEVRRRFKTDDPQDAAATHLGLAFEPGQEDAIGMLMVSIFHPDVLGEVWARRRQGGARPISKEAMRPRPFDRLEEWLREFDRAV
jgi:cellulose synthase (UDP-forming)